MWQNKTIFKILLYKDIKDKTKHIYINEGDYYCRCNTTSNYILSCYYSVYMSKGRGFVIYLFLILRVRKAFCIIRNKAINKVAYIEQNWICSTFTSNLSFNMCWSLFSMGRHYMIVTHLTPHYTPLIQPAEDQNQSSYRWLSSLLENRSVITCRHTMILEYACTCECQKNRLQWTTVVVQSPGGWIYLHIITVWIPRLILFILEGRRTVGNLAGIYF